MNNRGLRGRAPGSKVLLVEGEDDRHVVEHFCRKCRLALEFDIRQTQGINNLVTSIGPEVKASAREVVGIVADANDDTASRWQDITEKLRGAGIEDIPEGPELAGTVILGRPKIGIWLMPDNRSSGELEDFVVQMIPKEDKVWPMAQAYIAGIPDACRGFPHGKVLKAQLHAWLATREKLGRMGAAITAGDLHTDGNLCTAFADWLHQLYGGQD